MAREVADLNFEGAPPISIVAPKFKDKPKLPFKPRRWEQTPFQNSAQKDGLILRHWKREGDTSPSISGLPVTPADSNAASEMDVDDRGTSTIENSAAAKWNIKIDRPRYSDEEYEEGLKDDEWSKEETDYLVDLATEYDLRWVVVGDRYDYKPRPPQRNDSQDAMDTDQPPPQPKSRSIEDLKARYYTVAAKAMTLRTPLSSMNPAEFDTHEKMTKFSPKREKMRKEYAEKLFVRTQEEAHEEEILLKELSRIVLNQEKLYQERKSLYERLEAPRPINPAAAQASTMIYSSSQGLYQLMQSMLQSQRLRETERREKRRSALGIDTENANAQAAAAGGDNNNRGQRSSLGSGSTTATQEKRQPHPTPQHRPLSHAERAKYGVSYPQERLTSGVQFRHERVLKASQAKSAVQTTRINDALAELGIPPRLFMPTNKVVTEYERLVEGVKHLVEVRKLREKVDGEIKVWEAQRNLANGGGGDGAGDGVPDQAAETKVEDVDADAEGEEAAEDGGGQQPKVEGRADGDSEEEEEGENEGSRVENGEEGDDEDEGDEEADIAVEGEEAVAAEDREESEDSDDSGGADAVIVDHPPEVGEQDAADSDASRNSGPEEEEEDDDEDADDDADGQGEENGDFEVGGNGGEEEVEAEEEEGDDAAGELQDDGDASTRARSVRKRSASVVSAVSNKSSKRQRR